MDGSLFPFHGRAQPLVGMRGVKRDTEAADG